MAVVTMVPPTDRLPDVLPTERLNANGVPAPTLRKELRRIRSYRNAITVGSALVQSVGVMLAAGWIGHPIAYVVAFVLCGRGFALLAILAHEAAHRLLFRNRKLNDFVGTWILAGLAFSQNDLYRRVHMAHHRDEFGPDEPDLKLYNGYPITRSSMRRKLTRDAFFQTGWKNLKPLIKASRSREGLRLAASIWIAQGALVGITVVWGRWWLWPLLWFAPWMTVWRVINRLRSIAEHGGMHRSSDRRQTTHVIRQSWLARFWMVPYNTGWHLAHHVDIGVPWRNLPRLHRELVAAGWVTPELEHSSYVALWRTLSSRDEATRPV
jgi:fatty acid desaturase